MKTKFKPILFSTPMVQAIMEGRKLQTRRVMKPQPKWSAPFWQFGATLWKGNSVDTTGQAFQQSIKIGLGDILWVRETYTVLEPEHCEGMSDRFLYKASHHPMNEEWRKESIDYGYPYKWKPSIFMPKAACRIFLEVTNVRVERLQDIHEVDALAEGIRYWTCADDTDLLDIVCKDYVTGERNLISAYSSFRSLWLSINGEPSWDANPWVWVYDFKQVERPENF